jgi:hypothetical protein
MKKFLVLFRAPAKSIEQMMKATPEQQKVGMDRWMTWSKTAAEALVDMGAPLGKTARVTKEEGVSPTANDLCGYSILEAESKEALAELLKGHPHFIMPGATIDLVEALTFFSGGRAWDVKET